jgi:hypothetical protein
MQNLHVCLAYVFFATFLRYVRRTCTCMFANFWNDKCMTSDLAKWQVIDKFSQVYDKCRQVMLLVIHLSYTCHHLSNTCHHLSNTCQHLSNRLSFSGITRRVMHYITSLRAKFPGANQMRSIVRLNQSSTTWFR